jgi:hypothetical protein
METSTVKVGPGSYLVIAFMFFVVFGVMIGTMTGWW